MLVIAGIQLVVDHFDLGNIVDGNFYIADQVAGVIRRIFPAQQDCHFRGNSPKCPSFCIYDVWSGGHDIYATNSIIAILLPSPPRAGNLITRV